MTAQSVVMSNELSANERETILGLFRLGWSVRRIARETGHCRQAIRCLAPEAGPSARRTSPEQVPTDPVPVPVAEVPTPTFPPSEAPPEAGTRSSCEGHRRFIVAESGKGRTGKAIYQDLVEHHGYTGAYDAVKRFVRTLEPNHEAYAKCRFETAAGEEAQVDYGEWSGHAGETRS
jgi:hypothetical protein